MAKARFTGSAALEAARKSDAAQRMKQFSVQFANEPWRNHSFKVRGICKFDVLNPCWNGRKTDVPGQHWGGGVSCEPCTKAASEHQQTQKGSRS